MRATFWKLLPFKPPSINYIEQKVYGINVDYLSFGDVFVCIISIRKKYLGYLRVAPENLTFKRNKTKNDNIRA
jgi:hypothetical protein